ncbi:hypothetical protein [Paenibacillus sp. Soil724D2]|nr:hypothetical protein [Paenibacillus sp. Soil724D2]
MFACKIRDELEIKLLEVSHEGTIRQAEFSYNAYHDHEVNGILAEEWE